MTDIGTIRMPTYLQVLHIIEDFLGGRVWVDVYSHDGMPLRCNTSNPSVTFPAIDTQQCNTWNNPLGPAHNCILYGKNKHNTPHPG
jgi:hypothetical protein